MRPTEFFCSKTWKPARLHPCILLHWMAFLVAAPRSATGRSEEKWDKLLVDFLDSICILSELAYTVNRCGFTLTKEDYFTPNFLFDMYEPIHGHFRPPLSHRTILSLDVQSVLAE